MRAELPNCTRLVQISPFWFSLLASLSNDAHLLFVVCVSWWRAYFCHCLTEFLRFCFAANQFRSPPRTPSSARRKKTKTPKRYIVISARQYHHTPKLLWYSEVSQMDKLVSPHLSTSLLGLSPLSITPACIMFDDCRRLFMSTQAPPLNNPAPPLHYQSWSPCTHTETTHTVYTQVHIVISQSEHTHDGLKDANRHPSGKEKALISGFECRRWIWAIRISGVRASVVGWPRLNSQ